MKYDLPKKLLEAAINIVSSLLALLWRLIKIMIFLLIVFVIILVGLFSYKDRLVKNYGYNSVQIEFQDSEFTVELYGEWYSSDSPAVTEAKNPYVLRVCQFWENWRDREDDSMSITINDLTTDNDFALKFDKSSSGTPCNAISPINMPNHTDNVTVTGVISFKGQKKPFSVTLSPNYTEKRVNSYWEGLMGI